MGIHHKCSCSPLGCSVAAHAGTRCHLLLPLLRHSGFLGHLLVHRQGRPVLPPSPTAYYLSRLAPCLIVRLPDAPLMIGFHATV